jgi:hypothetical protein
MDLSLTSFREHVRTILNGLIGMSLSKRTTNHLNNKKEAQSDGVFSNGSDATDLAISNQNPQSSNKKSTKVCLTINQENEGLIYHPGSLRKMLQVST